MGHNLINFILATSVTHMDETRLIKLYHDNYYMISRMLAEDHVCLVFTGHEHVRDITLLRRTRLSLIILEMLNKEGINRLGRIILNPLKNLIFGPWNDFEPSDNYLVINLIDGSWH